jgi:MarR family transcriptional regulator, organic hydroperoxide resistance regulator
MAESSNFGNISDWVFNNIQKIFFPEEWINLDQSISKTELLALFFLDRQGEATMTKLADFLCAPLSTATGIVDRLVKNGLLSRERAEIDRRIIVLRLSDEGRILLGRLKSTLSGYLEKIHGILSDEERSTAIRIVMKVIGALNKEAVEKNTDEASPRVQQILIE